MLNGAVNGRLAKFNWGNFLKGGLSALNGGFNGRLKEDRVEKAKGKNTGRKP